MDNTFERNVRRAVICECGGDIYRKDMSGEGYRDRVWVCDNCGRETPRRRVSRRTNHHRAIEAVIAIRDEWKPIDAALDALVEAGTVKAGNLLVHSSVFNWHVKQLCDLDKPSNFQVRYHVAEARKGMALAAAFVAEHKAPREAQNLSTCHACGRSLFDVESTRWAEGAYFHRDCLEAQKAREGIDKA